jgi:hypothetical protein
MVRQSWHWSFNTFPKGEVADIVARAVPSETVVFEADPIFSDRSTDDTDFAWDMLLPVSLAAISSLGLLRMAFN